MPPPGAYDERGYVRIVGTGIDIGAYEFGATEGQADLSITGIGTTSVASGGDLAYDLTVNNNSTSAQAGVTLADVLPAGTTVVSFTPAPGWSSDSNSGSSAVSAWISSLAANSSAVFELILADDGSYGNAVISNTAAVGPLTGDPNPSNNSITFNTTVQAVSTSTVVTTSATPSTYGNSVTFTAKVSSTYTPTGSLSFVIDSGTRVAGVVSSTTGTTATWTFTTSTLSAGTHTVQALFDGTSLLFTNSNGTLSGGQVVKKANATVVVAPYTVPYDGTAAHGDRHLHHRRGRPDRGHRRHGHAQHYLHGRRDLHHRTRGVLPAPPTTTILPRRPSPTRSKLS